MAIFNSYVSHYQSLIGASSASSSTKLRMLRIDPGGPRGPRLIRKLPIESLDFRDKIGVLITENLDE